MRINAVLKFWEVASAVVTLGTAAAAVGQQSLPLPSGPVMSYDIAGVRLGEPAAEVRSALVRAGYRIVPPVVDYRPQSFEQIVRQEADRRLGRVARMAPGTGADGLEAYGPHREHVLVDMVEWPGGSLVARVRLGIPPESMAHDAFRDQVLAKYGRPSVIKMGDEGTWCSPETTRSCGLAVVTSGPEVSDFPNLTTSINGRSLTLAIGEDAFRRLGRAKEVAVEALAPKTTRGAF